MPNLFLFFLTIALEFILIQFMIKIPLKKSLLYIILINCITWPLANFLYIYFIKNWFMVELMVFIGEGFLIKQLFEIKYTRAFIISFILNAITALTGYLIHLINI